MHILLIDTCTERGVIAYGNQQETLFSKELPFGLNQSKFLMPYLTEALKPFGHPPKLDVVGVGIGPGSYTGIRLGVAVAQTLAYSWKVPLIGISSLEGFIPTISSVHYAAILDARIGGVYVQKGWIDPLGKKQTLTLPQAIPLPEVGDYLAQVTHLITPFSSTLQKKMKEHFPENSWIWEERSPCILSLFQCIEQKYELKEWVIPPEHLQLQYLRQTEAERGKTLNPSSHS